MTPSMRKTLPHAKNARLLGAILSAAFALSLAAPTSAAFAAPLRSEDTVVSPEQNTSEVAQDPAPQSSEVTEAPQTAEAPEPSISSTNAPVVFGQKATISLQAANTPVGTVPAAVVSIDGMVISTVALNGTGAAKVTVAAATLNAGEHRVSVSLVDTAAASAVLATTESSLTVKPATTKVDASWVSDNGERVWGRVTAQFGTVPTGTVDFNFGGKTVGSAQLAKDGSFDGSFALPAGLTSSTGLIASYVGDSNHGVSTATAGVVVVCYGPCHWPQSFQAFADVSLQHKFHTEIAWMYCNGYSRGWSQGSGLPLYKPSENLTRSAMAAFVYRLEAPKNYQAPSESPFSDVNPGDPFYKEITWMWQQGLSKGYAEPSGKPSFRPNNSLSREAMAAFMYRLEAPKNFKAPKKSPFADLTPKSNFYTEITWLYEAKLTTGSKTPDGRKFLAKDSLSREAMAAFVYRLVENYRA
ncbi:Ig-like domain repeat protein [Leucobacter viscericola]|uniref:Ig-like domain repeat protein n=1 Tax=Leucobacter viscericola TaxID=2714935 RepID=A0A6G7XHF9_9MICO|nr:S-layer homology domain-containing protein [Leucobacter viscericola]QIK63916.1 Ig-like domain repeat protein [Leucobacter viscericola]